MRYSALSIKQPWAALLVHGRKTIEVRRWSTGFRGELLLHAARIPDRRPQAGEHVQAFPEVRETIGQVGGVVGVGRLAECKRYRSREEFVADRALHLNDPSWFEPNLVGFLFTDVRPLPFHRAPGNVKIFSVELDELVIPALLPPAASEAAGDPLAAVSQRFRRLVRTVQSSRSPERPTE